MYVLHQVSPGSTYQLRKIVGPACYHLPGNWSTAIFHTQNVAMCTACKLVYHVTHITVKPQKPLTISGKGYYGDIVAY